MRSGWIGMGSETLAFEQQVHPRWLAKLAKARRSSRELLVTVAPLLKLHNG
jgi:hypothetical protein